MSTEPQMPQGNQTRSFFAATSSRPTPASPAPRHATLGGEVLKHRSPPPTEGPGAAETDALAELHTRLLDTIKGFDTILEKAEPEFQPVAAAFRTLHIHQAANVAAMLEADGHDPASDGSMFGSVNKMVVTVRSWFDDISVNIMDSVVNGEKHVLDGYDDALATIDDAERRRVLSEDRAALDDLLTRHADTNG